MAETTDGFELAEADPAAARPRTVFGAAAWPAGSQGGGCAQGHGPSLAARQAAQETLERSEDLSCAANPSLSSIKNNFYILQIPDRAGYFSTYTS